jgi:hypothetical protein
MSVLSRFPWNDMPIESLIEMRDRIDGGLWRWKGLKFLTLERLQRWVRAERMILERMRRRVGEKSLILGSIHFWAGAG